jgi:hypothetical protein
LDCGSLLLAKPLTNSRLREPILAKKNPPSRRATTPPARGTPIPGQNVALFTPAGPFQAKTTRLGIFQPRIDAKGHE